MGLPPVISPSASSTVFNDKTKYPYFLRTVSDDSHQAKAMADLIKHYEWSHVMCLYSEGTVLSLNSWLIMHQDRTNPSYINPAVLSLFANGFQKSRTQLMSNHETTVALGTHFTVDVLDLIP